jgi:hypothetical protein
MVIHLDLHQLAVLDFALCKVIVFSHVKVTDDGKIFHRDCSGMEQVFDDIESMLDFFAIDPSTCQWMMS